MQIGNLLKPRKGFDNPQEGRVYSTDHESPTIRNDSRYWLLFKDMARLYKIRKLTPRECFRLMGVPDTDIDKIQKAGVSESQQYKMAGNSIVVDVLKAIFTQMFREDGDTLF